MVNPCSAARIVVGESGSFADPVTADLATDENGTIALGKLESVETISVSAQGLQPMQFSLHKFHRSWPSDLHAGTDSKIVLPLGKQSSEITHFSLMEIRGTTPFAVHREKLKVDAGALEIEGLPAGNYVLRITNRAGIRIFVADAKEQNAIAAAKHRVLQTSRSLIAIRDAKIEEGKLVVKVTARTSPLDCTCSHNRFFPSRRGAAMSSSPMRLWCRNNATQFSVFMSIHCDWMRSMVTFSSGKVLPSILAICLPNPRC